MYQLTTTASVRRLADGAFVPADEGNRDYREYLDWLAEGNTPEPAPVPPVTVPASISRFQAFAAMETEGLLAPARALIAAPETPVLAKLAWESAQEFRRDSPLVATLGAALGLTEADLDDLFILGATIQA